MTDFANTVIAFDIDGVVLDYMEGFVAYARRQGVRPAFDAANVPTWSMRETFPDLDDAEIWALVEGFSTDEGFGRLKPIEGAVYGLKALAAEFPGARIVAITSAGKSDVTRQLRVANLEGIPFDEINVLPLGASKRDYFDALPPGSAYFDDLKKHVDVAEAAGLSAVLFRRSYNGEDSHARVADTWSDVVGFVRDAIRPPLALAI
jgi:FMN phosphatase YigB (HAD superfamily)